ncbi:GH22727 [Drosophila grimshawi]|uniref:GH22727 n=1 Tax=Drosophila grimshawi TaxID=7222 RepID=B4JWJ5_DROGR|nr:GH22727 [Drosophila grimshawi]
MRPPTKWLTGKVKRAPPAVHVWNLGSNVFVVRQSLIFISAGCPGADDGDDDDDDEDDVFIDIVGSPALKLEIYGNAFAVRTLTVIMPWPATTTT